MRFTVMYSNFAPTISGKAKPDEEWPAETAAKFF
jgi:hypothetical protein